MSILDTHLNVTFFETGKIDVNEIGTLPFG